MIGFFGYDTLGAPIIELYHGEAVMASIKQQYDKYGFWGVLVAAITPIPYKVFTISSGFEIFLEKAHCFSATPLMAPIK